MEKSGVTSVHANGDTTEWVSGVRQLRGGPVRRWLRSLVQGSLCTTSFGLKECVGLLVAKEEQ